MALSSTFLRRVKATKDDDEVSDLFDEASKNEQSDDGTRKAVFDAHLDHHDVDYSNKPNDDLDEMSDNGDDTDQFDEPEDKIAKPTSESNEHSEAEIYEPGSDDSEHLDTQNILSSISFGALASAQRSLGGQKRKRNTAEPEEGGRRVRDASPFREAEEREAGKKIKFTNTAPRPSKNAPIELSSKKAVSRKRQVVSIPKVNARDPRFSSLSGDLDVNRVSQKYAFLNDYRASEIADLKQRMRNTKDVRAKEALKREIKSMEDRERARKRAEEEKAVVREHRKGERERVKQGKKPFFLKKGEVKKQALVKRFEGMGEKKAEKVIERRRKKKAGKEKKAIPRARRRLD